MSHYQQLQDDGFRPETILARTADLHSIFKEPLTGAQLERALADFTLDLCHALRFPRHMTNGDGTTRIQRSLDQDETMWIEVSRKTHEKTEHDPEKVRYRAQFWRVP